MHLFDFSPEVTQEVQTIGMMFGPAVLQHHLSVLIILVDQGECIFGQVVEKTFFYCQILPEILVIIEMVAGEVCEDPPVEFQGCNPFLVDGVGGNFPIGDFADWRR